MASLIPACRHTIRYPFGGMKLVERSGDDVTFECPLCGERYTAVRCAASLKTGAPCRSAARGGHATCLNHRRDEKLGLIPSRGGEVAL